VQTECLSSIPRELVSFEQPQWYAVQTRSRHEKKVAFELREKGVYAFLPLARQVHRWSDRNKEVEVPLFPGYVFVNTVTVPEARVSVLRTPGVASFVGNHGKGTPIPDKQIQDIQAILEGRVPVATHPFLSMNQRVRIRGGSLEGVEGVLVGMNSDLSLVVSVDLIQRSVAIRVSGYEVEAA
jgi:transcription termination/antitermination protein NusG